MIKQIKEMPMQYLYIHGILKRTNQITDHKKKKHYIQIKCRNFKG